MQRFLIFPDLINVRALKNKERRRFLMDDRKIIEAFFKRNEDAVLFAQNKYGGLMFSVANNLLRNVEDLIYTAVFKFSFGIVF